MPPLHTESGVSQHPPKPPRCAAQHTQGQYRRGDGPYCFTRKHQESSIASPSRAFRSLRPRLARDACRVHIEHRLAFLHSASAVCECDPCGRVDPTPALSVLLRGYSSHATTRLPHPSEILAALHPFSFCVLWDNLIDDSLVHCATSTPTSSALAKNPRHPSYCKILHSRTHGRGDRGEPNSLF